MRVRLTISPPNSAMQILARQHVLHNRRGSSNWRARHITVTGRMEKVQRNEVELPGECALTWNHVSTPQALSSRCGRPSRVSGEGSSPFCGGGASGTLGRHRSEHLGDLLACSSHRTLATLNGILGSHSGPVSSHAQRRAPIVCPVQRHVRPHRPMLANPLPLIVWWVVGDGSCSR